VQPHRRWPCPLVRARLRHQAAGRPSRCPRAASARRRRRRPVTIHRAPSLLRRLCGEDLFAPATPGCAANYLLSHHAEE